jgi:hypothetical protein
MKDDIVIVKSFSLHTKWHFAFGGMMEKEWKVRCVAASSSSSLDYLLLLLAKQDCVKAAESVNKRMIRLISRERDDNTKYKKKM